MALDPQARIVLDQMANAGGPPINELSVEEARQASALLNAMQGNPEPVAGVEDRMLPGPGGDIPVRIYTPSGKESLPVLLYFHGGGWVLGDIESSDPLCRTPVAKWIYLVQQRRPVSESLHTSSRTSKFRKGIP